MTGTQGRQSTPLRPRLARSDIDSLVLLYNPICSLQADEAFHRSQARAFHGNQVASQALRGAAAAFFIFSSKEIVVNIATLQRSAGDDAARKSKWRVAPMDHSIIFNAIHPSTLTNVAHPAVGGQSISFSSANAPHPKYLKARGLL